MTASLPTLPSDPTQESRPPIWPAVIGILSIAIGANMLVGRSSSFRLTHWVLTDGRAPGGWWAAIVVTNQGIQLTNAALAVTAGVLLLKRRAAGTALLKIFAIGRTVQLLAWPMVRMAALREFPEGPIEWDAPLSAVGATLVRLPWPISLGAWTLRRKARDDVAEFCDPARRAALRPAGGSVWPVAVGWLVIWQCTTSIFHFAWNHLTCEVFELIWKYYTFSYDLPLWTIWGICGPAALGVVGAILLLRRKRRAWVVLMLFAILLTLTVVAGPIVRASLIDRPAFRDPTFVLKAMLFSLRLLVLPVFVMIWLLRPSIRQQMAGWQQRRP